MDKVLIQSNRKPLSDEQKNELNQAFANEPDVSDIPEVSSAEGFHLLHLLVSFPDDKSK